MLTCLSNGVHFWLLCYGQTGDRKMKDKNLTKQELEEVRAHFIVARDSLVEAASILQQSKTFENTSKDTKEVIGDLCIAIKAFNLV